MKINQRQPICISRLKKKPSSHGPANPNDGSMHKDPRFQLCQVNQNLQSESSAAKDILYRHSNRSSFVASENHAYFLKENLLTNQNLGGLFQDEQLLKRVKQLEFIIQDLQMRNNELTNRLNFQQNQKAKLNARIESLQKELSKLEYQFQQQIKVQHRVSVGKLNSLQIRLNSPKVKQFDIHRSTQGIGFRRLSFHQATQYHSEDLSIKLKDYKNQLEVQKIKRINLQRQLVTCKQNVKLQFKNQLQSLQHKIDNMKETITRKDKEINEKQDLIQRYIVKK